MKRILLLSALLACSALHATDATPDSLAQDEQAFIESHAPPADLQEKLDAIFSAKAVREAFLGYSTFADSKACRAF